MSVTTLVTVGGLMTNRLGSYLCSSVSTFCVESSFLLNIATNLLGDLGRAQISSEISRRLPLFQASADGLFQHEGGFLLSQPPEHLNRREHRGHWIRQILTHNIEGSTMNGFEQGGTCSGGIERGRGGDSD